MTMVRTLTLLALAAAVAAQADDSAKTPKKKPFAATCPVMGTAATEDNAIEFRGKKVYFCCPGCPDTLTAAPDDHLVAVRFQWLQTGQIVQVACPLTGKPFDAKQTLDVDGAAVAFCCGDCKEKASKTKADARQKLLFADFDKGFTLQTVCPLSDRAILPELVVEHQGKKVYFCCPGCAKVFAKEPEKHLSKLPQFAATKPPAK